MISLRVVWRRRGSSAKVMNWGQLWTVAWSKIKRRWWSKKGPQRIVLL
jgi:hypothetical protein